MNIQSIKAVSTKPAFDIQAALANPAVRLNAKLLASIGIEQPKAQIPLKELEDKMHAANLPMLKRLELKICLERVGLLSGI
jgi:hypothetical protein